MCVILHIVSPTTSDPSDKPESNSLNPLSATSLYVLWTACVEQGLVPMLEMIATGFPVCKTGKSSSGCSSGHSVVVFPEMEIQDSARLLLNLMSHQLALHSATSMQVRQKIIQSLTYSGSVLLKKNILLSVIYLCGRSNVLSSFMIHKEFENSLKSSMPSASTCSADDMRINLHTVFHIQSQDSDTVLLLLKHFLTQSLSEHMQLLFDVKTNTTKFTSAKRPKSAPLKKLSEVDMRSWPVILRVVDSQSRNDGVVRSIRMTCPPVEKIEMFFPDLAIRVEVSFLFSTQSYCAFHSLFVLPCRSHKRYSIIVFCSSMTCL
ncbi:hypothetical protein EON65_17700 [archaeon]|nr:MAG: hypothetical protein EON65_17700 [archaeon]